MDDSVASEVDVKLRVIAEQARGNDERAKSVAAANDMVWYLRDQYSIELDPSNRTSKMAILEKAVEDAEQQEGAVELVEAAFSVFEYASQTFDKAYALEKFNSIKSENVSYGRRVDFSLAKARLGMFHRDSSVVKQSICEAYELLEKSGGDWERRNRLRAYEGVFKLSCRDFAGGSKLLRACLATFVSTELMTAEEFIFYVGISSLISLKRVELKKEILSSSEILSALPRNNQVLGKLLNSFYDGEYTKFNQSLVDLAPILNRNVFVGRHAHWWTREAKVLAYKQFLESYRSVSLDSMAKEFGVSPKFLESELANAVSSGRVPAKIDSVDGVVETVRHDALNAAYEDLIKAGDGLLNKIQRLSRAVDV